MIVMTRPSHENIDLINILQQTPQLQQISSINQHKNDEIQHNERPQIQQLNNITNSNEIFLNLNESLFNLKTKVIYEIPHVNNYLTSKKYSKLSLNKSTLETITTTKKYPKWLADPKKQQLNQVNKKQPIITYQEFKQQKQQQEQLAHQHQLQLQQQKLAKLKSTPTLS
jgi:hypothetical protein